MNRIDERFASLSAEDRKALVTFVTAGDPQLDITVDAMHAMVAGGADVLELGIPFSDPEAEGPVIQAASERALANGVTLVDTLSMVSRFRETDVATPVLLMGYLNSLLGMGIEQFAQRASDAGVDGVIIVNLPPEEATAILAEFAVHDLKVVFLVAPTSTPARRKVICEHANGFLYYVSLKGITGADHINSESVTRNVDELRTHTDLPIVVGFGIKDGASAKAMSAAADGAVVGSVLVRLMGELDEDAILPALTSTVADIRQALDA